MLGVSKPFLVVFNFIKFQPISCLKSIKRNRPVQSLHIYNTELIEISSCRVLLDGIIAVCDHCNNFHINLLEKDYLDYQGDNSTSFSFIWSFDSIKSDGETVTKDICPSKSIK